MLISSFIDWAFNLFELALRSFIGDLMQVCKTSMVRDFLMELELKCFNNKSVRCGVEIF